MRIGGTKAMRLKFEGSYWIDILDVDSYKLSHFKLYPPNTVSFGMGGALVQQHNRDTHRIAYKCNAARVDGKLVDVYKDPATDPGKVSIRGPLDSPAYRTVFENGKLLIDESLTEIRARLWKAS